MYESPIQMTCNEIYQNVLDELDHKVFRAVANVNITVDRDELLKALAYDRGQYDKGYGDGYQDGKRDAWKWISTEERMPDAGQLIMICTFGKYVGVGMYFGHNGYHDVWKGHGPGTYWDDEITHWMPLPEPPKEVERWQK